MSETTQGIRYAGSKKVILPKIIELIDNIKERPKLVLDGFSGSTRVSQLLKRCKLITHSNDIAYYSYVLGNCYLINRKPSSHYRDMIDYLNNLSPNYGWYSEHYGGDGEKETSICDDGLKRPFQSHNTMKLDSIREEIDNMGVSFIEKCVLLTSLLLALDKVDNTLGHQVSYLKKWSKRSYMKMKLEIPNLIIDDLDHKVFQEKVENIKGPYDLVYYDPPYGTSNKKTKTTRIRYASYYHIWNTICLNDKPKLFGASKRREDVSSDTKPNAISSFENIDENIVVRSFRNILRIDSRHIILSYSNKGKLSYETIVDILSEFGKIEKVLTFDHKYNIQKLLTSNNLWVNEDNEDNKEFLFLLKK